MPRRWLRWLILIVALLLTLSFILPYFVPFFALASPSDGPTVRIALFLETADGRLPAIDDVTVTAVDLARREVNGGLRPSFAGVALPPAGNDRTSLRLGLNGYRLRLLETPNPEEALRAAQFFSAKGLKTVLTTATAGGKTVYRLESPAYAALSGGGSRPNALAAVEPAYRQALAAFRPGAQPRRIGPWGFFAAFESPEKAAAAADRLQAAGYEAVLAYRVQNGKAAVGVFFGAAADEAGRTALLGEIGPRLAALLGASAKPDPVGPTDPVVLSERDVLFGAPGNAVERLRVPLAGELAVASGGGAVRVEEKKDGRSYRGQIVVTAASGRLAVINALPLEAYLYGVVGVEMASGWPMEALKAQAVLARTYALGNLKKYGVADLSDTTYDQAYEGLDREAADVRQAVDATRGEVLTVGGRPAQALYSSNAGGMSAHGTEVWGNDVSYLRPVPSPDDAPLRAAPLWYRIQRSDGRIGYVHGAYVRPTGGTNAAGFPYGIITGDNVNFRPSPGTERAPIGTLARGEYVVLLEAVRQNNAYRWMERPYTGLELMQMLNDRAAAALPAPLTVPVERLAVAERGPSGRVLALAVDDLLLRPKAPDSFRAFLAPRGEAGVRSTRFDVEAMGELAILGAGGRLRALPEKGAAVSAVQSGGRVTASVGGPSGEIVLLGGKPAGVAGARLSAALPASFALLEDEGALAPDGRPVRVASLVPAFRLVGYGYGHGLGLSQYGAKALAEAGKSYASILQHYFQGAALERRY
ncbi:SpoIID/LytB domain-containing protein [Hydrogenibacillus sp. N12]|uniref:SpoIID/LytB domain-containing protein n=1 Tax=Hydrogenibacillus sp. N12 TaxID=2866627 RepID=UPI001C7D2213|nr:SpoIID/LytB domain-containing protein [Hydrogenibacillus sp. N12]QZA33875.1 SpoIID/LytB domain-containing protein [Hydrogenibacillus sp. N12]